MRFKKGIKVEVLDESDQFLKLSIDEHVEYVKNANMTSKDRYIVPLIAAKKRSQKILAENGFRVPAGAEFATVEKALLLLTRNLLTEVLSSNPKQPTMA